ncbi:MAG: HemK2/MTQ2 family protein methyltransferase [Halobacteriaceae archaeon]
MDTEDDLAARRGLDREVYGPAEDSALLAATAAEAVTGGLVLDVGSGSGYVAATVAAETGARVVGSDVNPYACRATRDRGVEAVRADLLAPFRADVFDAVLFNPPYLPHVPEMDGHDWVERALTAGETGRAVVDPFLDDVGRVLAPGGAVYLLVSTLTGVDEVRERARANGFAASVAARDDYPGEELVVLRLVR